jgi:hypothetical protein
MSFDAVKSALANGPQHLGDLIWWTLAVANSDRSTLESLFGSMSASGKPNQRVGMTSRRAEVSSHRPNTALTSGYKK